VIIPSYTCYSVPAAVARAGLKVRICDVDARTLDYDHAALERADFSRVLCVASANLYGIPNDLPRLRAIAGSRGAFVLDDAAQSMEARVNGEFSGTLGDVGIFSLDKGKNITTIDGGIIVTDREDLGAVLQAKVAALPPPSASTRLVYFAKLMAYSVLLHPRLYWMPDSAPFLKLGTTIYPRDLVIQAYPAFLAGVGNRLFQRIEALTSARIENARYLLGKLHDVDAVQLISILPQASPVFLRLPLLVRGSQRDRAVAMLRQAGIGASGSFPTCIADIPDIDASLFRGGANSEAGRWVAAHILTLPTHSFASRAMLDRAIAVLKSSTAA
jgi:dTDP-4-amino-4,6-dideoxygalactose transaminase